MDPTEQPPPPPPPAPAPAATPDAPDQETMEQIRKRRLQKLGGGASSSAPPTTSPTPNPEMARSSSASAVPTSSTTPNNTSNAATAEKPPLQENSRPKITISAVRPQGTPAGNSDNISENPRKRRAAAAGGLDADTGSCYSSATTPAPPLRKPTPRQEEPIEDYADRILSAVFRVTLDPNHTTDAHGVKLRWLANLSQELADEGKPLKMSLDTVEQAIMEAGSAVPKDRPLLDYLLPCWKRVIRANKAFRGPAPQKEALLKEARRLCFSNCIFALTMPELFEYCFSPRGRQPNLQHDTLVPYILRDVDNENGLCMEFFSEALSRLDEDESIVSLFTKAMVDISHKLGTMTMNDDFKPYVNALLTYTRFPPLLNDLAQHPFFQMAQSAPSIEKNTILGPFFRISPLQAEVTQVYFAGPRTMDKGRIETSQSALQMTLSTHQTDLQTIVNAFIRASPQARNKLLDWFAYIVNVNHKRRALHVDQRAVSSDGFMVNVTVILDSLCQPFMDSTFSKVGRIDVNYFRRNPRVDIKDETKLNADQAQSDKFYATKADGESNFITEVFFLTLAAHHYGSEAANAKMKSLDKDIKYYQKNLAMMEAERTKLANRPDQLLLLETTVKRHVAVLEKAMALKYAIEGVLLEEKMQSRSLQFMRYVTVWLLRVASQSEYTPEKQLKLPLPAQQPEAFSCLPEYALQDIVDNFKFIFRYIPRVMLSAVGDELVALCITFLESSEYIRNPYLKSALVTLLFHGTWGVFHLTKGVLGDLLTNTKFANDYLLHAVMKFYIECESTGTHTAFYDKFNIRYEIFQVIKCVWTNDVYKQQLTQSSKTNRSFFIRFVNLLMNDATYVLDEGLSKFPKIHDLQVKLREQTDLSDDDRDKLNEELKTAESQATSFMQLVNETVAMMKLFTETLGEAFTMPEIVQRLAGMLNYNLEILTGPKSRTLKVDRPEQYHFTPRTLMPQIIDLYLNLSSSRAFIEAVAADGRSYKPELMTQATYIMRSRTMKPEEELVAWDNLRKKFEQAKFELDRAELDYGDAPAEFEDPIMGDLMKDPVILPSRHVVDRSTIIQHLLSDPKDPFTRQPMKIEDVVADEDLRVRIEKWKEERRREARGGGVPAVEGADASEGGDKMDTTE
ncbi:ubiquitin elongating factor core-domain-containing protein [Apodospora peruviana]|uniref:Ubiquitin elongating factor core-domain-containing protein n=1 Tax=Apodospora peruviana TaxID=516989 RepID=A0AAE0M0P2_9PEZI|nr:ubiquitin elongating factor core-domain-containing protein [Apodospora peruviana]